MARLIPEFINPDCKSSAERKIFERFRNELPEEYTVLHSLGLGKTAKKIYSEIDFVVVGREGALTVEVKGGDIKRHRGIWYFVNRFGESTAKHESPMEQAKNAFFDLRTAVRAHFGRRSPIAENIIGFVTFLKDIPFKEVSPEWDKRRIYDKEALASRTMRQVVEDAFAYAHSNCIELYGGPKPPPLSATDQENLVTFLRRDFELVRSIGTRVDDAYTELLSLSPSQYHVLDYFRDSRRLIVTGGAGSGKTLLAFEKARREAASGRKVCLLCFNQLLAAVLARRVATERLQEKIEATTLHAYCLRTIKEAGMENRLGNDIPNELLYAERFPSLFPEAFLAIHDEAPFDTLIIDEGQDFRRRPKYFELTDFLVRGGLGEGSWVWFEDDQQTLFIDSTEAVDLERFSPWSTHLLENWRNTGKISMFNAIASRTIPLKCVGPEGEAVVMKKVHGAKHELETLEKLLQNLAGNGCRLSDIVILSAVGRHKSVLHGLTEIGGFSLCELTSANLARRENCAVWTSVYRFKGLESKVVILVDVGPLSSEVARMARYVGISRANSYLAVLWNQQAEGEFQVLATEFAGKMQSV